MTPAPVPLHRESPQLTATKIEPTHTNPNACPSDVMEVSDDDVIVIEGEDDSPAFPSNRGPDVVRPALERCKLSGPKRLPGSNGPTLVSGVGFVTSLTCPPWPVALLPAQGGSRSVTVKLLGLFESVAVSKTSLHLTTSASHIRELQHISSGRGPTPDFAAIATDWSTIKRYYTKALEEALAITMRLQHARAKLEKEAGTPVEVGTEILVEMY
jgi:hypothetical protein